MPGSAFIPMTQPLRVRGEAVWRERKMKYNSKCKSKRVQTLDGFSPPPFSQFKLKNLDGALVGSTVLLGTGRAVDKETGNLDLASGIEGHQTDVSVGESLGASLDLLEDLGAIGAAEHGELPHGPVAVVLVTGGGTLEADARLVANVGVLGLRELEAGGESVADLQKVKSKTTRSAQGARGPGHQAMGNSNLRKRKSCVYSPCSRPAWRPRHR